MKKKYRPQCGALKLSQVKESNPLVTRRLGDLNTPFANATWSDALNTLPAKFPAFTASSYVQVRDEPLLYAALGAMSSVNLERARLYAIVLLLAQVIRYRYILGVSSRALTYECLSTTGSHFPTVFLPWSYGTLVERDTPHKLRQMADIMKESFRAEVGLYGADLGHWSVTIVGESKESYYNATRRVTPSVSGKPAPYGEASFLVNVVRARADSVGQEWDDDGDVDRQLRGSLQFKPSSPSPNRQATHVVIMSAALLADPFFIGDPALPELDYGTVGVRLLAQWLNAELRSNTPMREMIANFSPPCPPGDAEKDPIFDIAGEGKQTANQTPYANSADVTTELALRTALAASRATRLQPQRKSAASSSQTAEREVLGEEEAWLLRDRVFFWRFCHSLCGDARQAGLCDHVIPRVTGFAKVFACDPAESACVSAAGAVRLDTPFYLS
ncbi:hypothetical protein HPB49_024596 [Dermacentor silvarum]|uniref:Uncharacterized protein n=1 Tax=Dermacentor silvarum TaxID=543639 RepID=A0ACB8CI79_DERSI|nr:hypothetical protein HPB49_024596 [Dermacentor silvarum]